jgi:glycosyltransferase involved in cell wall biosynthesis
MIEQAYGIPSSRFSFIPNGVSPTFLEKPVTHTPDGPLVFFGRLEKTKGVDVLIEALTLLDRKGITYKCVIAGRGRAESTFKQAITEHGLQDKVEWTGWMAPNDLANLLASASVAVLPSREESFGNAMAEAMAAGVPVASTEVGSIPEVVVNGETGYLVPSGDAVALAQRIQDLLEHPETAQALGRAGRKRVRSRFTWPSIACEMERIYDQLTSEFEK